jgi:HAMP domain-containing protein
MTNDSTRWRKGAGPGRRHGPTLAARLFLAITLVIVAGAVTVVAVSVALAPAVFHRHLSRAGVTLSEQVSSHVNDGFTTAVLTGTAAGVTAAAAVAIAVTVVITRRITQPVSIAAHTAQRLADGDYSARMPAPRVGPELAALANAAARRNSPELLDHLHQSAGLRLAVL